MRLRGWLSVFTSTCAIAACAAPSADEWSEEESADADEGVEESETVGTVSQALGACQTGPYLGVVGGYKTYCNNIVTGPTGCVAKQKGFVATKPGVSGYPVWRTGSVRWGSGGAVFQATSGWYTCA